MARIKQHERQERPSQVRRVEGSSVAAGALRSQDGAVRGRRQSGPPVLPSVDAPYDLEWSDDGDGDGGEDLFDAIDAPLPYSRTQQLRMRYYTEETDVSSYQSILQQFAK